MLFELYRYYVHSIVFAHARPLLAEINILNVCQIKIRQILTFMQKVKNAIISREEEIQHYSTRFSKYNFNLQCCL